MKKRNLIFLILAVLLLAGCSGLQGSRTAAAAAFLQRLAPEAEITEYRNAYGPCLLLEQDGSRYFLGQLPCSGAAEQKEYEFSGMRRTVQTGNKTFVDILLPLHCVEDPRVRDSLGFRLQYIIYT